jgi:large subunit ribosomal protein L35
MPKNKPNKGLLKRIRITASGRVKHGRAFGRHRRSHKSGQLLRSYHRSAYAHSSDVRRVASMLHRRITASSKKSCSSCCTQEPVAAPVEEAVVATPVVEAPAEPKAKKKTAKPKAKAKAKAKPKAKPKVDTAED